VVIFIHRKGEGEDASYELVVPKVRGGKTGTIPLEADLSTYTFREADRSTEPFMAACNAGLTPRLGRAK